ncbi:hypothetical protein SRABI27_04662 [Pedobacter sp. Bi27]|nr:hypothetical protein SRABI36_01932 [Pedobacter sp. Bi36]CAH0308199.1 hypothetical protein SRABI27_04662 [Pedobacter sp. Bi27]
MLVLNSKPLSKIALSINFLSPACSGWTILKMRITSLFRRLGNSHKHKVYRHDKCFSDVSRISTDCTKYGLLSLQVPISGRLFSYHILITAFVKKGGQVAR